MKVRNATEADLPQITALWLSLMAVQKELSDLYTLSDEADALFEKASRPKLANPAHCTLVAEDEPGDIAGFGFARIEPYAPVYALDRYCLISDLSVDPKRRRSGVGQLLLDAIRAWAGQQEVGRFQVTVARGNEPAEAFWDRHGFAPLTATYVQER